jgi:RNA polymerase sigma factor (TIGR02999 family)
MNDVTQLLEAVQNGEPQAAEALLPRLYNELRQLAALRLAQEKPGQTLQATALVHEAYLRLVDQNNPQRWNSRGHFFAAAAEAMRRILVEKARQKLGPAHGGHLARVDYEQALDVACERPREILHIHDALNDLAQEFPIKAELVKLRFFAGLSHQEATEVLGISRATADRYWAYAKAFLFAALQDGNQEKSITCQENGSAS